MTITNRTVAKAISVVLIAAAVFLYFMSVKYQLDTPFPDQEESSYVYLYFCSLLIGGFGTIFIALFALVAFIIFIFRLVDIHSQLKNDEIRFKINLPFLAWFSNNTHLTDEERKEFEQWKKERDNG